MLSDSTTTTGMNGASAASVAALNRKNPDAHAARSPPPMVHSSQGNRLQRDGTGKRGEVSARRIPVHLNRFSLNPVDAASRNDSSGAPACVTLGIDSSTAARSLPALAV